MNSFFEQLSKTSDPSHVISLSNLSFALLSAFLLCLLVAKTYQYTYRGVSYSAAFMHTLIICGMVIAAVMIIIGSNVARAFSLVGALSIVRFRNAVKDPRDVAYIFLSMGVGMACGTAFYQVAVALTAITCGSASLLHLVGFGEHGFIDKILRIQAPATDNFQNIFDEVLRKHSNKFSLISVETSKMGTELELTFSLRVGKSFDLQQLIKDLAALNKGLKVEVTSSDHVLEL